MFSYVVQFILQRKKAAGRYKLRSNLNPFLDGIPVNPANSKQRK